MFGKKHAPKAPWSVQLLTTDFLVAGHLDGDDPTGPWFLHVQAQDLAMATLPLADASIEPSAGQNIPETRAARWVLPSTGLFVGMMPRDEAVWLTAPTATAARNMPWRGQRCLWGRMLFA